MNLTSMLLNTRNRKSAWYDHLISLPLSSDEREAVDALFEKHNPTFGQAYALIQIEKKYSQA